jgi:hypothetical protein
MSNNHPSPLSPPPFFSLPIPLTEREREKTHFSATLQSITPTKEESTMAKQDIKTKEKDSTKCYTYAVTMIIQVIAESEQSAKDKLDKEGGYVTNRVINLVDSVSLYSGESKE